MIRRVTQPSVEPVTLAEAKAHLRVDIADDDGLIGLIISAAREAAEKYCSRSFASADYIEAIERIHATEVALSYPDITAVASVSYVDSAGVTQTMTTGFTFDAVFQTLTFASLPSGTKFKITFTAGPSTIPPSVKQSILLKISDMYENRSEQGWQALYINRAAQSLLSAHRTGMGV